MSETNDPIPKGDIVLKQESSTIPSVFTAVVPVAVNTINYSNIYVSPDVTDKINYYVNENYSFDAVLKIYIDEFWKNISQVFNNRISLNGESARLRFNDGICLVGIYMDRTTYFFVSEDEYDKLSYLSETGMVDLGWIIIRVRKTQTDFSDEENNQRWNVVWTNIQSNDEQT